MAKGHLSEDTINFIMTAETSQLQQEIHKTNKTIDELRKKEAELRKEQAAVKSVLGEESQEYKDLSAKIKKVNQDIADESLKLTELHKKLGTGCMTMAQLRKEAKTLQRQLDNTSQALNPQEYDMYAQKLKEVNQRMAELKATAQGLQEQNKGGGFLSKMFGAPTDFKGIKTLLAGNAITKFATIAAEAAARIGNRIKDLISDSVQAAREAEGITRAFRQLDNPTILDNLRQATHGTVSDLELMKAAVQAKDFRLPLDQLGKYLEFAQLKAQQTGQSVDYMTNSIVTGLGRKSVMILDNLGISAAQIREEMAKGGDMAQAVGRIIDKQLAEQGEHYETAAEREAQATTAVTNAQLELGNQMQDTFGIGSASFSEMQAKAETFILKGLTKLIIYLQDLYDKTAFVRAGVELVKVAFDTVFKVCEVGFLWIIDAVKSAGRTVRDMAVLIEGAFSFDWDKVKSAWNNMLRDAGKSLAEFARDGKDVGQRWGNNVVDSINKTIKGRKIDTPKATSELDEVTVVGTKRDKAYWEEQLETRRKVFEATKKGSKEAAAALRELQEAERELAKYNTYSKKDSTKGDGNKDQKTADRHATDTLKRQRQEEIRTVQQNYVEQQRLWKEQLSKRTITQQEYDAVTRSLTMEHNECVLDIERKYARQSQELALHDADMKKNLVEQLQDRVVAAENNAAEARLKAFQDYQKNRLLIEEKTMTEAERTERANQLQIATLDAAYQASLQYATQTGEDTTALTEAYEQAKARIIEEQTLKTEQRRLDIKRQMGTATAEEELRIQKMQLEQTADSQGWSPEERAAAELKLEEDIERKKQQIRQQYGLTSKAEEYRLQMEQLEQYKQQELITEEQYEEAKKQMRMQKRKEDFDYWKNTISTAVSALQDAELAQVESKYDAEIAAAKKAGKDTTALENKKEEEKLKIQKKYADVNFAVKCAEIISNTAVAIMKALAELGPIAGPIAAGLMGVTGAAQLAIAKAERDRVKNMTAGSSSASSTGAPAAREATGLESGGSIDSDLTPGAYIDVTRRQDGKPFHAEYAPDRRGFVDRPTVIVGEGPAGQSKEWVASNAAVENPTVRPVIDVIEQAQRTGSIRTLDLRKVMMRQQGLAQGGYITSASRPAQGTSPSPVNLSPTPDAPSRMQRPSSDTTLERLADVLDRIERNGINALVGIDQVEAEQKQRDRARAIATK